MVARVSAAVAVLGAIALIAVYYHTEDNSTIVTESARAPTKLPETVDNFLEVSVTQKASFDKFHEYKDAKAEAAKSAPAEAFTEAVGHCKTARVISYKQCATHYCEAKDTCGHPCEHPKYQPPLQVVPLTKGMGSRFYRVHEVTVKENDNKEKHAKENHAKELAEKERGDKEHKYKESVTKEKSAKLVKKQERLVKEKQEKENHSKERVEKERVDKIKEKTHKAKHLLDCTDKADVVLHTCTDAKAAEEKVKVEEKEELKEKAQLALESAQKTAILDASKNASNSTITTDHDAIIADLEAAVAANTTSDAELAASHAADERAIKAAVESTNATHLYSEYDVTIATLEAAGSAAGSAPVISIEDFSPAVRDAIYADKDYADVAIPSGGQRRLLQSDDADATASEDATAFTDDATAADDAAEDDASEEEAEDAATSEIASHIADLEATVATDTDSLTGEREAAALAVNQTAIADETLIKAEDAFKNDKLDEENMDNIARLHASKAAYAEAKVRAVDSYVSTHQGDLHKTNCSEEKKFSFNVCFGRASYKGQLLQTDQAKECREKANAYQAKMGDDYAVILDANKTYEGVLHSEEAAEAQVKVTQKQLVEDQKELAAAQEEMREMKAKLAAKVAAQKKAEDEAAAAAAMAAVMGGSAASLNATEEETELYSAQAELYEELLQQPTADLIIEEDAEDGGRRLLATPGSGEPDEDEYTDGHTDKEPEECTAASNKAFGECQQVVDMAYAGCTQLFKNAISTRL